VQLLIKWLDLGMTLYHIGYAKVCKILVLPCTISVIGCDHVI